MVSLMCLCNKYTLIYALFAARPLHPLTGKFRGTSALRKDIQYICEYSSKGGLFPTSITLPLPCQRYAVFSSGPPATLPPGPH